MAESELALLLESHFDGRAAEHELVRLAQLLTDPHTCREARLHVALHRALRALHHPAEARNAAWEICAQALSHSRRLRVQREVARRTTPRSWWLAAAAATLIAAGLLVTVHLPTAAFPELSADGRRLTWPDSSTIDLSATAQATPAAHGLTLAHGQVEARIAPQSGQRFTITTPHATVAVVGTHFTVDADRDSTWVSVVEGTVDVNAQRVSAGAAVVVDRTGPSAVSAGADGRWDDRRAIGLLSLAAPGHESSGNPRGYDNNPSATLADNVRFIKERFAECVPQLRALDAQGLLVWDAEGRGGAGSGYLGDPRLLAGDATLLAVLDAGFADIRAKGFAVGVLIATDQPGQAGTRDLARRLAWARQRWGITLAEINNLVADNDLRQLAGLFPDVRLITVAGHPQARIAGAAYYTAIDDSCDDRTVLLTIDEQTDLTALRRVLAAGTTPCFLAWYPSPSFLRLLEARSPL